MRVIEVINLSNFPVTLTEVGFTLNTRNVERGVRAAIPTPKIFDGGTWPRRLGTREAISAYIDGYTSKDENLGKAYAKTACGETRYSKS